MSQPRKKKTFLEWWMERITTLKGYKQEANSLYSKTGLAYNVGAWAVIKLAFHAYFVDVYSGIIKANFTKSYYVDVFSASGLDKIDATGDIILGSAPIADRVPKTGKKFDKIILIEKNPGSVAALRKILPNAVVIDKDANTEGIDAALGEFKEPGIPFLAFVDPEGLAIDWAPLSTLLAKWCDVIVKYEPTSVRRIVGSSSAQPGHANALDRYFGTREWRNCNDDQELLNLYVRQISRFKDVVIPIRVNGSPTGNFHYYVIFAARKTSGSQGWIDAINRAKEYIEKATSDDAERFLGIYSGKQELLDGSWKRPEEGKLNDGFS